MDRNSDYLCKHGIYWDFEIYDELVKRKRLTALHKFYSVDDILSHKQKCEYYNKPFDPDYFMISTGISDADYKRLCDICSSISVK